MMAFFGLLVLVVVAGALAVAVVLAVRAGLASRTAMGNQLDPALRSVRRALLGGLLAALATVVLSASIDGAHQDWMGIALALGPGVAVSVGLAVIAAIPVARPRLGAIRTAGLAPRSTWTIGTRGAYVLPAAAAALLGAVLVTTGVTASNDDAGLPRALTIFSANGSNTASPYPGWYYAGPLLVVTALLLLTALLAMRRVATLPAIGSADDGDWRRSATSAISLLATTGLTVYLSGTLLVTAHALLSAAQGTALTVLGWVLLAIALPLGVLACIGFVVAIVVAATFRSVLAGPAPLPR